MCGRIRCAREKSYVFRRFHMLVKFLKNMWKSTGRIGATNKRDNKNFPRRRLKDSIKFRIILIPINYFYGVVT